MIFDAGVFILAERNPKRCAALLKRFPHENFHTNEAVLAQVWRKPKTQVPLTRFIQHLDIHVHPLTEGKAIGILLDKSQTSDVVDASIALLGLSMNDIVLTSDPDDLQKFGVAFVAL